MERAVIGLLPQTAVIAGPDAPDQLLLLSGQRVGAQGGDPSPPLKHRIQSGGVEAAAGDLEGVVEVGIELGQLLRCMLGESSPDGVA